MRLVYFGSGSFAVPALNALCARGNDVACVVTQPDRPKGRGLLSSPPPVKATALALGLPVEQPTSCREADFVDRLRSFSHELQIVAAYGRILPPSVFDLPRLGTLNVHASLLPRYRGAAPIQWAILNGETETGVTIIRIDEGLDTGPICLSSRTDIGDEETSVALEARLAALGADLVLQAVDGFARGQLTFTPQDHERASLAPRFSKQDAPLDWRRSAATLARRIRALHPWPGTSARLEGRTIKILRARTAPSGADPPGTLVEVGREGIVVACGAATRLRILDVQPECRRSMSAAAFAAGARLRPGLRFDT